MGSMTKDLLTAATGPVTAPATARAAFAAAPVAARVAAPVTASARAHEFAKWAILSGVFPAGTVITEATLCRETGLSRGPVHVALIRLEAEGMVTLRPGRGAVVNTFSLDEIEDVLEARVLIENHTAGRSFQHRATLLPQVEAAHAAMREDRRSHDTAAFTASDRLFHELIVDAAGNAVLSSIYRTLRERQTLFTSSVMRGRQDRMQAAIDEHDRIIGALRGNDRDAFCTAVDEHLRWSIALARASV
jgi:DNA-binding GntR family transcriptional regulator